MTTYYVRNAGSNTAPYDTWAKAATSLAVVTAVPVAAADTIWVADDHAESVASSQTWTCPTTPGLRILCANTHTTEPPTGLATSAVLATTSANFQLCTGYAYIYGLTFQAGSASGNATLTFGASGTAVIGITLDTCTLYIASANTNQLIQLGSTYSGGIGGGIEVRLLNCVVRYSHAGQTIKLLAGNIYIDGLTYHASSTAPTTMFGLSINNGPPGVAVISNSDLSGKTATNLFTVSSLANTARVDVRNCKLPASIAVVTGTIAQSGGQNIRMENCDSGDTHIRYAEYPGFAGSIVSNTSVVLSGGAVQDDAQAHSWLMTGNANTSLIYPLRSPPVRIWNNTLSSMSLTMEFIRDNVTNLTDAQVWVEVTYMGTSGFPMGTTISDRVATVIATPADQDASSVTWANSMSNPNKQKAVVTFTPAEVGYIIARVCLGANTAIYVDPLPVLT